MRIGFRGLDFDRAGYGADWAHDKVEQQVSIDAPSWRGVRGGRGGGQRLVYACAWCVHSPVLSAAFRTARPNSFIFERPSWARMLDCAYVFS